MNERMKKLIIDDAIMATGLQGIAAMLFDENSEHVEAEVEAGHMPGHVVYIGIRPADADPHEHALRESIARSIENGFRKHGFDLNLSKILKIVRGEP